MADPKPIQKSDDPRLDWRQINAVMERNKALEAAVGALNGAVNELRHNQKIWQAGGGTGKVTEVTITSVSWDHYVCWNGSEQILVAKPYKLRRSPFIGGPVSYVDEVGRAYTVTYNYTHPARRSATINGTLVEYQVVIPRYVTPTDKIYILEGSITVDVNGVLTTLGYLDLNADGRAWARER